MTVTALKEWSAAVHALLDGRQQVLLVRRDRLDFRPKHRLAVLVVQARQLNSITLE